MPREPKEHAITAVQSPWKPGRYRWKCVCGSRGHMSYAYPGLAEAAGLHHLRARGTSR